MRIKVLFLFGLLIIVTLFPVFVEADGESGPTEEELARRQALAESGTLLFETQVAVTAASASDLADAIDIPSAIITNSSLTGPPAAVGVFSNLGVISPRQGNSLALLSSGVAGTSAPEPGVDFSPISTSGDRVTLSITVDVPKGANRISFDYNFLSAEFPDFIGSEFNDTFTAILTDSSGVKELARASVNSSSFFPASSAVAGGSGFDIFADDPSGVDEVFTGSLPDAGLTGYISASDTIADDGSATLEFSIEDRGDGILDSAVIIDNLVISSLEIIDPNPTFLSGGSVITDAEQLSSGGDTREGAAADGVTRVLLRNRASGPGTVEFCINGGTSPEDGSLSTLGSSSQSVCVISNVVDTSNGHMAFAIYLTPDEFNRGGDENLGERPINFSAHFSPASGTSLETDVPFKLVRPPVVLLHGLWSEAATWDMPLITDSRFLVQRVEYKQTNADHFSTNLLVPLNNQGIRVAITSMRNQDIAATQVDIAGHSMGGILSRNFIGSSFYKVNENYNEGDIHKIITLNTPHTGSPLANLLNVIRGLPFGIGSFAENKFAEHGMPIDRGAIDDLAKGSAAINAIPHTPVPSHALVGTGGSDALSLLPGKIGTFYTIVNFFANFSDIFQGLQHDGIVGRNSQEGGLPANAFTVFGGVDSIHCCVPKFLGGSVTNSSDYSAALIDLFNSPASGSLFGEFPAPSTISSLALEQQISVSSNSSVSTEGLIIVSPPTGTQASSGESVQVVVETEPGVSVDEVLLIGPGVAVVDDSAPFEFDLMIPSDVVGSFEITAAGKSLPEVTGFNEEDGISFFGSNSVTLEVEVPAVLESVMIIPQKPIFFSVGETLDLTVLGTYSDGLTRDITSSSTGTMYITSDSNIASVSNEGVITSSSVGIATIAARNGTIQDSISVMVVLENSVPIANAGDDQTVQVGNLVNLDGSGSFDPDSGPSPLSFSWSQISGPTANLSNGNTSNPSFTPNVAGNYTFGLIVSDGQADSSPDSVTIEVLASSPPTANAGGPYETTVGNPVTLDASGSTDPDGEITLYEWDLDNDSEYDDATGATTDVVFNDPGTFTVGVRVTDDSGATDTDTAQVIVSESGEVNISNQLELIGLETPPTGSTLPGEIYEIGATFKYNGAIPIDDLVFEVTKAENRDGIPPHPELDNRDDGSPPGVGARLTASLPGGSLSSGDTIHVVFKVLLQRITPFEAAVEAFTTQ